MAQEMSFSQFARQFHNNDTCLEEIKRMRYPKGISCLSCKEITNHYRIKNRPTFACVVCRKQTHPLTQTIFEKSSTSLRLWFYALFLMTYTKGTISALQLQKEVGVTYKTAWRMKHLINEHLVDAYENDPEVSKVHKWVFFKHFEIAVIEKDEESGGGT